MRANFIFSEVWIGLRRNLTMTIAVVITVAVGMAMLGVGLMINAQVSMMQTYWYDKVEISVFLCADNSASEKCGGKAVTPEQTAALKTQLEQTAGVAPGGVIYEDQKQAYENFKQYYATNKALIDAASVKDMPTSFRIKLTDPENYEPVMKAAEALKGVSQVVNQREIIGKFFSMLDTLRWAAVVIAVILVLAAALLIGNTVRLSAFNRRRETGIMRLVGASNLYIQLPFVMEGMIAGLIGGVLAAVLLIVAKVFMFEEITKFIAIGAPLGWDEVAQAITLTMVIGVLICVLASSVTLRRYLRV
ncbi:permease-like cell division protein FtsX [Nonomuraea sp. NPDC050691]|uniref:permease-like cell division protein FtsX n=1 Tax=Nonomuraea sp. NPDC050691 TaxID=3155661 RepID=UPI003409889E